LSIYKIQILPSFFKEGIGGVAFYAELKTPPPFGHLPLAGEEELLVK
jgi:hypothetical protein